MPCAASFLVNAGGLARAGNLLEAEYSRLPSLTWANCTRRWDRWQRARLPRALMLWRGRARRPCVQFLPLRTSMMLGSAGGLTCAFGPAASLHRAKYRFARGRPAAVLYLYPCPDFHHCTSGQRALLRGARSDTPITSLKPPPPSRRLLRGSDTWFPLRRPRCEPRAHPSSQASHEYAALKMFLNQTHRPWRVSALLHVCAARLRSSRASLTLRRAAFRPRASPLGTLPIELPVQQPQHGRSPSAQISSQSLGCAPPAPLP
ncbi:hypothetical protein FB451DRAFT_1565346 [Mycena latifolia]|nr:hypothetical protein FB451DRAFT_1565346 [Mycena latifolia]